MHFIKIFVFSFFFATLLNRFSFAQDGEIVPKNEQEAIRQITEMVHQQVLEEAEKQGHAFRDAHRKHHGCVQAKFTVKNNLSGSLKYGLFKEAKPYPAILRFSNSSGQTLDDREGDGRGIAIKILGTSGERNLGETDDEVSSQDFLMINHPVFIVRNAHDYVGFQKAALKGQVALWMLHPFRIFHEGMIARTLQKKIMLNPLNSLYYSMTPSKLGPTQMKFRVIPCPKSKFQNPSDSIHRLRENLEASLSFAEACFLFQVQIRTQPNRMPIEDATIEWKEQDAPFSTVAEISIPQQKPKQGERCEILSFNPWNGLREHRPLGGISRVRKAVYQTISRARHEFNQQRREEPNEKAWNLD